MSEQLNQVQELYIIKDLQEQVTKLSKLLNNQSNELFESTEIDKLAAALCKAQAEMLIPEFNNSANYGSFCDITALIEASRPALTKYGLSTQEKIISDHTGDYLSTILRHESGQWTKDKIRMIVDKEGNQGFAGCNTYIARLSYGNMVGIARANKDNDADTDNKNYKQQFKPTPQYQQPSKITTVTSLPKATAVPIQVTLPKQEPVKVEPIKVEPAKVDIPVIEKITIDQLRQMEYELDGFPKVKNTVLLGLNLDHFRDLPKYAFTKVINRVRELVQLDREIRNKKEVNG